MKLLEKGHKERYLNNGEIIEDYFIFETDVHFINITSYKRIKYLKTNTVIWETFLYGVSIYTRENDNWRRIDERATPFSQIPDLEKQYQRFMLKEKIERLV